MRLQFSLSSYTQTFSITSDKTLIIPVGFNIDFYCIEVISLVFLIVFFQFLSTPASFWRVHHLLRTWSPFRSYLTLILAIVVFTLFCMHMNLEVSKWISDDRSVLSGFLNRSFLLVTEWQLNKRHICISQIHRQNFTNSWTWRRGQFTDYRVLVFSCQRKSSRKQELFKLLSTLKPLSLFSVLPFNLSFPLLFLLFFCDSISLISILPELGHSTNSFSDPKSWFEDLVDRHVGEKR
jgi:hypothetical protein